MAEPTLMCMVESLRPGGCLVITGFTTTFITPMLLRRCGLVVRCASVPSVPDACGLETDLGLFQMWVLEKAT